MERGSGPPRGAISLDELIALNDEIAALVRAGVPLERGLAEVGGDMGGRLGAVARALGTRLERGETLVGALGAERGQFPEVYRAVVEAGLRAGRLPVALEGMAGYARAYAELRRAVGLALVYPMVVVVLGYTLFLALVWQVEPRMLAAAIDLGLPVRGLVAWLGTLARTMAYWGPVLPALLVVGWLWWAWSGRSAALHGGWSGGPLAWLPWMRTMLANTRAANFAELLALLVEHRVPLPEALPLAASAAGDASLRRAAAAVAESSRAGQPLREGVARSTVPPLLGWLMATGGGTGGLAPALRHAAQLYRRRALNQAEMVRIFLPTLLMLGIGATVTLFYSLALFAPLAKMLNNLSVGHLSLVTCHWLGHLSLVTCHL
jgi:general secretion pathway protein F